MLKIVLVINIFVETVLHSPPSIPWQIESLKEKPLFEIFSYIIFTVTFDK